jgi:hypothetical protein
MDSSSLLNISNAFYKLAVKQELIDKMLKINSITGRDPKEDFSKGWTDEQLKLYVDKRTKELIIPLSSYYKALDLDVDRLIYLRPEELIKLCEKFQDINNPVAQKLSDAILNKFLNHIDPKGTDYAKARYNYKLLTIDPKGDYSSIATFIYNVKSKESDNNFDDLGTVVDKITSNKEYAWRGMSYEEWENIKSQGFIKSRGVYNIGDAQAQYTMFGEDDGMAQYYATGFAPFIYKPVKHLPGVVIGVPKDILLPSNDKDIPLGEMATKDSIPLELIKEVYYIIPTESNIDGVLKIKLGYKGNIADSEFNYKDGGNEYIIKKININV